MLGIIREIKKKTKENTSEKKLSQRLAEANDYEAIIREENRLAQIEGARKAADGTNKKLKDSAGLPN